LIEIKNNELCHFVIRLAPITKKNHSSIITNKTTGKLMVIPSKQYKEYEHESAWFMPHIKTIDRPVNIRAVFYMPTHRRVDLVNLLQALCDILVKYSVIEDDNFNIVAGFDGSRVDYDKDSPRTEVWIYEH
jgi:Holliday junction resolvase RusA-like endonuclease